MDDMDNNIACRSSASCFIHTSNGSRHLIWLYEVDEALIMMNELTSDLSEERSDTDDPTYEPASNYFKVNYILCNDFFRILEGLHSIY